MFLAMKELKHNKSKYALIMTILVLLTFLVLFLAGLANGLGSATSALIKNAEATHYLISEDADELITRSQLTEDQWLQLTKKTEAATPLNISRAAMMKREDDKKIDITYVAVDPNAFMMPSIIDGASLAEESTNEIVLNNTFEAEGIQIGDMIIDPTSNIEFKVVGFVKDQLYAHSNVGFVTLQTFKEMRPNQGYHGFALKGDQASELILDKTTNLTKNEVIKNIPGYAQEQATISMILIVLLLISAVILAVFFYVMTIQKIPQFGTLKALGIQMKSLRFMVLTQVLMIAGISMVLGNVLTFALASVLPSTMPFTLNVSTAALISVIFVVIALLSNLFTMSKISKVDPLMAIGGNE
ncbi:MAG: ABC transporter permease [Turicibacter sp.]|nr:ABC transporter permease [Turicibacter sp.]